MNGLRYMLFLLILFSLLFVYNNIFTVGPRQKTEGYRTISSSELMTDVQQGKIRSISISGGTVQGRLSDNEGFVSRIKPEEYKPLLVGLSEHSPAIFRIQGSNQEQMNNYLMNALPWLILVIIWIYIMRNMAKKKLR